MTSKYKLYSISSNLRSNNKSSDEFEIALNALSLEEVIALKLELSSRTLNKRATPLGWSPTASFAKSSEKSATVTRQLSLVELSHKYLIKVTADLPAPITNIFFIFFVKSKC